jgi:L-serine dehydratase
VEYFSIFNDVLGPVMTGPSSSHTAGCARIGAMTRILHGREIRRAEVIFDQNGSYPGTCRGQGSDRGFTGGLLGFSPDDLRLKNALEIAEKSGVRVEFKQADLGAHHPNEARINVYDGESDRVEMSVLTRSVGGGMIEIVEMDGFPVSIKGETGTIYIAARGEEAFDQIRKKLDGKTRYVEKQNGERILFEIRSSSFNEENDEKELKEKELRDFRELPGIDFVRVAEVILPAPKRERPAPPFENAAGALERLKQSGEKKEMWELAVAYEKGVTFLSADEIFGKIREILQVMRESGKPVDPARTVSQGFLGYQASGMLEKAAKIRTVNMGFLEDCMIWAVSVMENNCARNKIVAAPTAGSCGVIPASVVAIGDKMGCSDEAIEKALLAAGLVGVFIANSATFGAEVAGCQAENGAAGAMAAAGVVQLLGGSVENGFQAASLALQNLLGLICDPVGGLAEVPCVGRNVAAAFNAVVSANMVMCGYNPIIPLDETIDAMFKVGKMLPEALRCTCRGGLCDTPTAKMITERLARENAAAEVRRH